MVAIKKLDKLPGHAILLVRTRSLRMQWIVKAKPAKAGDAKLEGPSGISRGQPVAIPEDYQHLLMVA